MELETIIGNLKAYNKLKEGSFQCVDSLMDWSNKDLKLFYTADGQGYFLRGDGGVDWAITREWENLVLRHIDDKFGGSFDQLVDNDNYIPNYVEAEIAKDAVDTVVVDMGKLRLSRENNEFCYLQIRTSDGFILNSNNYERPNAVERKALDRLGHTLYNLKSIKNSKYSIGDTRIYVVNPAYVKDKLDGSRHSSLWRASWLYIFEGYSYFDADVHRVNDISNLRGLPKNLIQQII